jgi:hypothetical protein
MDVVRRFSLLATAGLLCIAVMLGSVSARPSLSASAASQLAAASGYFDSTIVLARTARPTGRLGDQLTIGLGYLERLRLGLGSPFRLVNEALRDPRGDSTSNSRIAWALLGRLRRGEAYVIDPTVLDGSGPWSRDGHGATGAAHVALIERAIADASDPRAGELAVRLAYMIEASKGTIAPSTPDIANQVAALVRDRALATEDLGELLSSAALGHRSVMAMLVERRANRVFRVEQPAMAPLSSELRTEAMEAVPALVAALDTLERADARPAASASLPLLGGYFAERLAELGARRPTIAQIVVTMRGHPRASIEATNDETLAAARRSATSADTTRRANALAMLAGAIALRPYNQDAPWFAGMRSPDVSDLAAEFGLGTVTFARAVPAAWHGYYLRELRDGLRDIQEVFPALSVVGLNVHFGTASLPDSALAMHDPRSRTLQLTENTSSGTIAHELAHDLDWQTSRRMFARAGGYSTDRAVRERPGTLASSVRGLAEARSMRPGGGNGSESMISDRPAELFARSMDWFVTSSLAARGRSNGFLSAVQDPALPGYAAGSPTAVGAAGAASLVAAIDQMTYISESIQTSFEAAWADPASIDPVLLVRRVLSTPLPRVSRGSRAGLAAMLPPLRPSLCIAERSDEAKARERIALLAVHARAKGIVDRRARYRFPGARNDWVNGLLGVAPWSRASADALVASLESGIIAELRTAPADQGVIAVVPASFGSSSSGCAPLAR